MPDSIHSFSRKIKNLHNRLYVLGTHWARFREEWFRPSRSDKKIERALDAGCGNSWVKNEFGRFGCPIDYVGIDLGVGDSQLEYSINALADLHYIPFKNNSFDKVFSNSVLEHVELPSRVFEEMSRVTAPGGRIYISVPFTWMLHQRPYDNHRFTKFILETYAKNNGLEVLHLWPMGGYFSVLRYLFTNYDLAAINDNPIWRAIFWPFTQIMKALDKTILGPIVYLLDKFDKFKYMTLGYFVIYQKSGNSNHPLPENPFRCPLCQCDDAEVVKTESEYACTQCRHHFPKIGEIPDLSLSGSLKPRSNKFAKLD